MSAAVLALREARRGVHRRQRLLLVALGMLVVGLFLVRALLGDYRISFVDGIRMVTGTTMSPRLEYAGSFAIWAAAASPISRLPQPTLQYQRDAVASRYRFPSTSQT